MSAATEVSRAPRPISVTVNGTGHSVEVEPRLLLVDLLRERLGLKGTHIGCDTTSCGACTVLLDGAAIKSCTIFAVQADGRDVRTVEGLASDGRLHPLQVAFREHRAFQCGYCTSGMLMSSASLLARQASPSEDDVKRAIAGNLCRCTGYHPVVEAVKGAAAQLRAGREGSR